MVAGSPRAELAAAVAIIVVGVLTAILIGGVHRRASRLAPPKRLASPNAQTADTPTTSAVAGTSSWRPIRARLLRGFKAAVAILSWAFGVLLLNSLTVLYLMTYSLPDDNLISVGPAPILMLSGLVVVVIAWGLVRRQINQTADRSSVSHDGSDEDASLTLTDEVIPTNDSNARCTPSSSARLVFASVVAVTLMVGYLTVLGSWLSTGLPRLHLSFSVTSLVTDLLGVLVPVMMNVMNAIVIPAVSKPTARLMGARRSFGQRCAALVMLARFVTAIFIPVATTYYFGDGCLAHWRSLWAACDSNAFDATVDISYTSSPALGIQTETLSLMTTHEICTEHPLSSIADQGVCVRTILWILLPVSMLRCSSLFACTLTTDIMPRCCPPVAALSEESHVFCILNSRDAVTHRHEQAHPPSFDRLRGYSRHDVRWHNCCRPGRGFHVAVHLGRDLHCFWTLLPVRPLA